MGRAKDWQLEQEERGWFSVPGKHVCSDCVDDDYLKQLIKENAKTSGCDYCGLTAEDATGNPSDLIAAPFDSVMQAIAEGLQSEWNNADDEGIVYESAEGGYQAETFDSYDLVWEHVGPTNDDIANEIIRALPDHAWVQRHYYSLSRDQALWYGWKDFCDLVKHQNRYMFHLRGRKPKAGEVPAPTSFNPSTEAAPTGPEPNPPQAAGGAHEHAEVVERFGIAFVRDPINPEVADIDEAIEEAQEGISASRILDAIGEAIEEVELIRELDAQTELFRGRIGPASRPYTTCRSLGPPPPQKATASRMSPAGIPMFYGAMDEYTAVAETVLGKLRRGEIINVGRFATTEKLLVLDLTHLLPVPSIFSERRYLRPVLRFLHSFVRDLSKSIKKDGREHIEYVPTQIVTEYFRHSFLSYRKAPIRGVLYPSARAIGGIACVLFVTRKDCGIPEESEFELSRKPVLRFVRGSAKTFRRKPLRHRKGLFE